MVNKKKKRNRLFTVENARFGPIRFRNPADERPRDKRKIVRRAEAAGRKRADGDGSKITIKKNKKKKITLKRRNSVVVGHKSRDSEVTGNSK